MSELYHLQSLANDPAAQADYAVTLVTRKQPRNVQQMALRVLAKNPTLAARPVLLEHYGWFMGDGLKRDPGAYVRGAVLAALRPVAHPDDLALAVQAVLTYEFLPPAFREEGALLRAGGLLIVADLDDRIARFLAARLLGDEFNERMSGEPGMTAIRVLASFDEILPLYQYAVGNATGKLPELVSECLRSLTSLPVLLVPPLVERFAADANPAIKIGLWDLLIQHQAGPQELPVLARALARESDLDILRYLAIGMLTTHHTALLELVQQQARREKERHRLAVLREVLEIFGAGEKSGRLRD
jgi:hypothetical protein